MYKGEKVDTVFIGGGTPTSLDAESLKLLLDRINSTLNLDNCSEFTVEMNPKTVDEDKLQVLKNGGVTRLSVGVQSFCDEELKRIGRVHTSQEAKETIEMIKNAGFENFSIDLMSALPGQTLDSFKYSLDTAIELNPAHISCYSLILEEGTPLYEEYIRGELNLPDEDTEREMYDLAVNTLNKAGYKRYEISNFSKENFSSTHNIKYWKCMEYIGVGLSAHSYLDVKRFSNSSDFDDYVSGDFSRYNEEKLDKKDMMSEFMFMGLRMSCGVSSDEFFNRFGEKLEEVFCEPLLKYKNLGMIEENEGFYRLSDRAVSVSNSIMCEFIL